MLWLLSIFVLIMGVSAIMAVVGLISLMIRKSGERHKLGGDNARAPEAGRKTE